MSVVMSTSKYTVILYPSLCIEHSQCDSSTLCRKYIFFTHFPNPPAIYVVAPYLFSAFMSF